MLQRGTTEGGEEGEECESGKGAMTATTRHPNGHTHVSHGRNGATSGDKRNNPQFHRSYRNMKTDIDIDTYCIHTSDVLTLTLTQLHRYILCVTGLAGYA